VLDAVKIKSSKADLPEVVEAWLCCWRKWSGRVSNVTRDVFAVPQLPVGVLGSSFREAGLPCRDGDLVDRFAYGGRPELAVPLALPGRQIRSTVGDQDVDPVLLVTATAEPARVTRREHGCHYVGDEILEPLLGEFV